jgi:hypothetical protein
VFLVVAGWQTEDLPPTNSGREGEGLVFCDRRQNYSLLVVVVVVVVVVVLVVVVVVVLVVVLLVVVVGLNL